MKYGEQFEKESVPGWSLHNIDYNSLKHHIKVHTTRDQATAMVIPGHRDTALGKFENELYTELCVQHDRVDLFVTSKADEIARRLQHLSNQIHQSILRHKASSREHMSLKRQRRFAKYEQALFQCGDDIQALQRFVNAQVVAFRKILKKYRKWTGSPTLGSRFKETVLSHPKSFTKRDFSHLQAIYEDLLATLTAATPTDSSRSLSGVDTHVPARRGSDQISPLTVISVNSQYETTTTITPTPVLEQQQQQRDTAVPEGYWNEYDNGSEAGDFNRDGDSGYAIYINPNEEPIFPGWAALVSVLAMPVQKVKALLANRAGVNAEHGPLLPTHSTNSYGTASPASYSAYPHRGSLTETEAEEDRDGEPFPRGGAAVRDGGLGSRRGSYGYASSEELPAAYVAHYATLPSIDEQRMMRYREHVLFWGTIGSFAASMVLLGVAALLILTGRHRWRVEVDAGVTIGVVASLGCACAGLGMTFTRHDRLNWPNKLAVWVTFATLCILNGILLVLVAGNTAL